MRIPWVDEEALAKAHPSVFHYTRIANLGPILRSGGLLVTHHARTNDRAEFRALRAPLVKSMRDGAFPIVLERLSRGDIQADVTVGEIEAQLRNDADTFFDVMVEQVPSPPHIACFSAHDKPHHMENGLLTMWRMYGGKDEGIAFGFQTKRLVQATERLQREYALNSIYLDRVGYGIDDTRLLQRVADFKSVARLYAAYLIALIEKRRKMPEGVIEDLLKFLVLSACAKHPDFEDEREIRLVLMEAVTPTENGRPRLTRQADRLLVPCLDALDEVIVGPSRDQDKLVEEVQRELDASGYSEIAVRKSETPFRNV